MEDCSIGGGRIESDILPLSVRSWISVGGGDHSSGEFRFGFYCHAIEPVLCTSNHHFGKIRVFGEKRQKSLCFGIATPDVVFEDFWPTSSHHNTSKEYANKWESYGYA